METTKQRFVESTQRIFELYHDDINVKEAIKLMRDLNITAEVVESIYAQLSAKSWNLMKKRFHYYTIEGEENFIPGDSIYYWTSRYLLAYNKTSPDSAFHEIKIIDLFNDKSINVTIEKSARYFNTIYYLKDGFGLLKEYDNNYFISLISLDIPRRSFQKLHTVEKPFNYFEIVVNKADPTTFLLNHDIRNRWSSRICKIVEKRIIIGEVVDFKFYSDYFYDKIVYFLKRRDEELGDLDVPKIYIYNLEEKTENQFDLEAPTGYKVINIFRTLYPHEWIRDNLFISLISSNGSRFIGYYNVSARKWTILDFYLRVSRYCVSGFEQENLIIHTKEYLKPQKIYQFYKIPFGKPDLLENLTWLSLVKAMKKCETVEDPYEAARKYLPPNSSINCPFKDAK